METLKKELTLKNYKLLFETLYPKLCVFANKYLDNLDTAKDLVQEVFIKVWEEEIRFNTIDHAMAFFYTSVKHKCINLLNSKIHKKTVRFKSINLDIQDIDTYFTVEAVTLETIALLKRSIGKLPYKAGQVILLSLKDFTNKQIANKLNISVNTVKDHKKVAYHKLRGYLSVVRVE